MVLPWLENGSLRRYLDALREDGKLEDAQLVVLVDKWVSCTSTPLRVATKVTFIYRVV